MNQHSRLPRPLDTPHEKPRNPAIDIAALEWRPPEEVFDLRTRVGGPQRSERLSYAPQLPWDDEGLSEHHEEVEQPPGVSSQVEEQEPPAWLEDPMNLGEGLARV